MGSPATWGDTAWLRSGLGPWENPSPADITVTAQCPHGYTTSRVGSVGASGRSRRRQRRTPSTTMCRWAPRPRAPPRRHKRSPRPSSRRRRRRGKRQRRGGGVPAPRGTPRGPQTPRPPGAVVGAALSLASLLQVSKRRQCITTGGTGPCERSPCLRPWSTRGRCHPPQPCSPKAAGDSPAIKSCVSSCTASSVLPGAAGPNALTPGPSQTPSASGSPPSQPCPAPGSQPQHGGSSP